MNNGYKLRSIKSYTKDHVISPANLKSSIMDFLSDENSLCGSDGLRKIGYPKQTSPSNSYLRTKWAFESKPHEMAVPHFVAIPLSNILEEYPRYDNPLTTFDKIFNRFRRQKRTKFGRNEWLTHRFEEIRQEIRDLFIDLSGYVVVKSPQA